MFALAEIRAGFVHPTRRRGANRISSYDARQRDDGIARAKLAAGEIGDAGRFRDTGRSDIVRILN